VASAIFPGGGIRKVTMSKPIKEKISVIGLGYVGLPLAVALADKCDHVLGFDISKRRVDSINAGEDWTGEVEPARLAASGLRASSSAGDISGSSVIIVTVPTPVDADKRPDLTPIRKACETIAPHLCGKAWSWYSSPLSIRV
jgi:UDP-N-acetyl-D-galactosamine dehydrogenase